MMELKYKAMCLAHLLAKRALNRQREPIGFKFVDIGAERPTVQFVGLRGAALLREPNGEVSIDQLYPVENATLLDADVELPESFKHRPQQKHLGSDGIREFKPDIWRSFIDRAAIPIGYKNAGLKFAGYIASGRNSWCLPSWVWTNGAVVRYLCNANDIDQAIRIGDLLLRRQEIEGGWIVRSDYTNSDEIPVMAPNDSAYIANNACLELYASTRNGKYLSSAIQCADWIIETARPDGLVWTGYDMRNRQWLKRHTIVDTGFTAGLFARLYMLTENKRYRIFLERFVDRFIELFYDPRTSGFATNIDPNNRKAGGRFARGQAWALEGLIPAYRALGGMSLKGIIEANVDSLIRLQLPNGGWAYNFDRPYLGEDCKGISVIAKAILDWYEVSPDERILGSAHRALGWSKIRTALFGEAQGGIFSFNMEGAVVHNFYSETAFVYSSAYALESLKALENHEQR